MINFDDLRTRVNNLDHDGSPSAEFTVVFGKITKASKEIVIESATAEADKNKLFDILKDFIVKIPTHIPELRRTRADANDLLFALGLDTVKKCIDRIKARNKALDDLTKKLNEQNELAVEDAKLLTKIKEALDNATMTVTEVKALVAKINDDELDLKTKLLAFIKTLDDLSTIFKP